jgi:hypothetical protein
MGTPDHDQIRPGITRMKENTMYGLTAFFLLLPFAYAAQVLAGRPEVAVVAYLPLLAAAVWTGARGNARPFFLDTFRQPYDLLGLGVLFLLIHSGTASILALAFGEFKYGIRGFFIYFLPLTIIPLVRYAEEAAILRLLKVFTIVGTVVALEMTYENFYIYILGQTTTFQRMNFGYVYSVSGLELSRLYATNYRPTGLLEHIHASVFFAGITAIAWLARYFMEGRRYQLVLFSFCSAVFALHGARLAFGALTIGVAAFLLSQWARDPVQLQKVKTAALVFGSTVALALLLDPFGTVRLYYLTALLHNDFGIVDGGTPFTVYRDETARFIEESPIGQFLEGRSLTFDTGIQALFGFGVVNALQATGGTSDDAFYLQLLGQYGLLGSLVFFGMWIYAIRFCYRILGRLSSTQRCMAGFSMALLVVFILSIIHSPAIQRKGVYPLFIFAIALAYRFRSLQPPAVTSPGVPPDEKSGTGEDLTPGLAAPPSSG